MYIYLLYFYNCYFRERLRQRSAAAAAAKQGVSTDAAAQQGVSPDSPAEKEEGEDLGKKKASVGLAFVILPPFLNKLISFGIMVYNKIIYGPI